MNYSIKLITSFKIKNQKDKKHSFIFPTKKNECSTAKIYIFKKLKFETRNAYLAQVKTLKLAGVSQYSWWVLYTYELQIKAKKYSLNKKNRWAG
jgi:hypothetical protein